MSQKLIKNRSEKKAVSNSTVSEPNFNALEYHLIVLLTGLCSPIVLIFLIHFIGNSELIEEIFKALFVLFVVSGITGLKRFYYAGLFAVIFTVSESVLYLNTILQIGNLDLFVERIILTAPMHILTTLIIVLFSFGNKKKIVIGFILALILHLSFNHGIELYF